MTVCLACPAKLNLFLSVGPPDASGYHPLKTIFQAISLCDQLTVSVADQDSLHCSGMELPAENTLTKTLRLYRELWPVPPLRIELEKRIPSEAGLGGGSSDAAGLLRAISLITRRPIDEFSFDVATSVGADVPFFLVGGRARGDHYGERITALPDGATEWYVVAKPSVGAASGETYRRLDAVPREFLEIPDPLQPYNDFERVAPCESLELIELLRHVGSDFAALTGSGTAVFGRFPSELAASEAQERMPKAVFSTVVRSLTREECL